MCLLDVSYTAVTVKLGLCVTLALHIHPQHFTTVNVCHTSCTMFNDTCYNNEPVRNPSSRIVNEENKGTVGQLSLVIGSCAYWLSGPGLNLGSVLHYTL